MSESYEDLSGAVGRARFFRPTRYGAARLFSGEPPTVWFEDSQFALSDISATGLGCKTSAEPDGLAADTTGILRITQRGRELFRARARLARINPNPGGAFAGIMLEQGSFDLAALKVENARAVTARPPALSDYDAVPAVYKSFCADAAGFIASHLAQIERFYAPLEGGLSAERLNEISDELAAAARRDWIGLLQRGNELVLPYHDDPKMRVLYKDFTEKVVTPHLLAGEGWSRSYHKPLGYPGDYQIMNYIYNGDPVGSTIAEKFLHLLSLIGSAPVKTRMSRLTDLIVGNAAAGDGDRFEFMSIGSGPARELADIAAAGPDGLHFGATLIDQEDKALDYAVKAARDSISGDRMSVTALNISFKEMLNPSSISGLFAHQDIIYSSGLVDYLNPLLAQRFVKRVYRYLKPGGKLIIGNLNNLDTGMIWPCEYITDWSLYFRSREDMIALAQLVPDAKISIESDAMDAVYFLIVEKPGGA